MSLPERRRSRHTRLAILLLFALMSASCGPTLASIVTPSDAGMLVSDALTPPPDDAAWVATRLPDNWRQSRPGFAAATSWYRIVFDLPAADADAGSQAVYLPYLYQGGHVYLNGTALAHVRESDASAVVRWERPHLLPIPEGLARPGRNVLLVRKPTSESTTALSFPSISIGPQDELLTLYERRLFWVRTMPQITVATCALMASLTLFIWLRRRQETLYALLGMASLFWGIRTLTFVIEQASAPQWLQWRLLYHMATGGFVVVMALFALRFAQLRIAWLERALVVYWLIGPLAMLLNGRHADIWVGRVWAGGLIPIGLMLVGFVAYAAWRQRTWQAGLLLGGLSLAVAAGLHDYLVSWSDPLILRLLPEWSSHRLYLLHHAANLLLMAMAGIMTARFVVTLDAVEDLNQTLEQRVAERERQLATSFQALSRLERERAIEEERQRIMRDMHDGLGSELFTSLARVERGAMMQSELGEMLRRCIDEMRLALDALAPTDDDFRSALGNFRYRWEAQFGAVGMRSTWTIVVPGEGGDDTLNVPVHERLPVLRILQEALTNVLKHAHAQHVEVRVSRREAGPAFEVVDDGIGWSAGHPRAGRGLDNMRSRAHRIGARLDIDGNTQGTRVLLQLDTLASLRGA